MNFTRFTQSAAAAFATVALLATTASAVPLTVTNYNFSSDYLGSGVQYASAGSFTGWSLAGFSGKYLENGTNGGFTVPISSPGSISPPATTYQPGLSGPYYQYAALDQTGTIYQDLGVAFAPNTTYTVDISLGRRSGFFSGSATFGLVSSVTSITSNGPGTTLATEGVFDVQQIAAGDFNWASVVGTAASVFSFTTGATAPSGNIVVYVHSNGARKNLGGVSVTSSATAVPEIDPAGMGSVLALVTGALGILERRRLKMA